MPVETRLYDILGVSPEASAEDIKRAFKRLALKHHPDRGGDTQKFQEINAAHEILSNSDQREVYDRYGEDGLTADGAGAGGGTTVDGDLLGSLFGSLFGRDSPFGERSGRNRGAFNRSPRQRKPADTEFGLQVSLEDIFSGLTRRLTIDRTAACSTCQGTGATHPQAEQTCEACRGQGRVIRTRRVGPGMIQQVQMACDVCKGQGRLIPPEYICQGCRGSKVQREKKTLEVVIPAGSRDGQKFLLPGAGDHFPDMDAGDLVCVLQIREHARFARQVDNLISTLAISLVEALTGCSLPLKHLDGRTLLLRTKQGEVIKPGSWWRVKQEGMPVPGKTSGRGDLLLRFQVTFPEKLDAEAARHLADAVRPARTEETPESRQSWWQKLLQKTFGRSPPSESSPAESNPQSDAVPQAVGADVIEYFMEEVRGLNRSEYDDGPTPYSRL